MKPEEKEKQSAPIKDLSAPLNEQNFLKEETVIAYLNRNILYPRSEWPAIWRPPTFKPIQKPQKEIPKPNPKKKI